MRKSHWAAILGLATVLSHAGCATVPPTAELAAAETGYSFSGGRGIQSYPFPPSQVLAAVREAMADLELQSIEVKRDGSVSRAESQTTDGRSVVATLRSYRSNSVVTLRVGWFGDGPLSQEILKRTAVRLGSQPPEAIPSTVPSSPSRNPYFSREAIPDSEMYRDLAEAPYRDRVVP